jgi:hypothetical protein
MDQISSDECPALNLNAHWTLGTYDSFIMRIAHNSTAMTYNIMSGRRNGAVTNDQAIRTFNPIGHFSVGFILETSKTNSARKGAMIDRFEIQGRNQGGNWTSLSSS